MYTPPAGGTQTFWKVENSTVPSTDGRWAPSSSRALYPRASARLGRDASILTIVCTMSRRVCENSGANVMPVKCKRQPCLQKQAIGCCHLDASHRIITDANLF